MDIEKVKDNIRKMLNLANDPGAAQGEIDNAIRFASKLMDQHQLTEEDVKENKVEQKIFDLEKAAFDKQSFYCLGSAGFLSWHNLAINFTCELVGGIKWYYRQGVTQRDANGIAELDPSGRAKTKTLVTFYGVDEDVAIAVEVINQLMTTILAMAKLKFGVTYRGPGRSYCEGFMDGLWRKLRDDKRKQKALAQASQGTALMVIDQRALVLKKKQELAENWLHNAQGIKPKTSKAQHKRRGGLDAGAYREGESDGKTYTADASRRKKLGNG